MGALPGSAAYAVALADGRLVTCMELEVQRPGGTVAVAGATWAELAHGAPPGAASMAADSDTLRASDLGYVSRASDTPASAIYPPTLVEGFASNRAIDLNPAGTSASLTWGDLRLTADDRRYDAGLIGRNADQRLVRVLIGRKSTDAARGIQIDPAYSALAVLFSGLAQQWQADEGGLSIPIRDQTAWLDRPYLQATYGGTGGADGSANLAGRLKPRLRGGDATVPVANISPILIDPVANVWQYTDGAGGVVSVSENGISPFTSAGNTADLWSGSTPAGQYRTDNSKGLFQLGSPSAGQITIYAWGQFPGAGAESHVQANTAALRLLRDDMAMPTASFDAASFTNAVGAVTCASGWYWDGSQQESCAVALGRFLGCILCRLVSKRDGTLACLPLRAPAAGTAPDASYGTAHIVSLRRAALPDSVSPPLYRVRWGYQHNHTVMTTFNGTVAQASRQFFTTADRFATAIDNTVQNAYRRPNDTDPIPTALLRQTEAQGFASLAMALWSVQRRLYSVELPVAYALRHEMGDVLSLTYPLDDLDAGRQGVVVGEQLRLGDATSSLLVLV